MIEVDSLTRYYGRTRAIHDVSFRIDQRAIVGFLGLNGAGKSTLLKILGGLLRPSSGSVTIDGADAVNAGGDGGRAGAGGLRRKIGFLPEEPPLHRNMRVEEFLTWCGRVKGATHEAVHRRLPDVLDICDINHVRHRVIDALSHGYRKRVGIAQAIIHDPELVILDEPISGLDPVQIVGMRDVLRRLREQRTVLVSSHILAEISETCDRILVLHRGELVADGSESQLRERLRAGARLELELRGRPEQIETAIRSVEAVADWHIEDLADGRELEDDLEDMKTDGLRVDVDLRADAREELAAALVEAGVGLRGMREAGGKLEQLFLGVTEDEEAAS